MPLISKKSLRRDRILHAAGQLFAHQGYHGTTTRQIAHAVGIAENTLFRHFDDKESLFWATLRAHFGGLEFEPGLIEKMENGEPPEVVLPQIVEMFTDTASDRPEVLRLAAVAFLEMQPKGERFLRERFSPALTAICRYLDVSVRGGKIRNLDPTTATVAMTMTILMRGEISRIIDKDKPLLNHHEKDCENWAQTRFWLDTLTPGMSADPSPIAQINAQINAESPH